MQIKKANLGATVLSLAEALAHPPHPCRIRALLAGLISWGDEPLGALKQMGLGEEVRSDLPKRINVT